jgi:DNA primase
MFSLVQEIWRITGKYPRKAVNVLNREDIQASEEEKKPEIYDPWSDIKPRKNPKLPDEIVEMYPVLLEGDSAAQRAIIKYLVAQRHISMEMIDRLKLRYCPENSFVVLPYTNHVGDITYLQARKINDKKIFSISPKFLNKLWLSFLSPQASGSWFGLHLVDWREPVYIVEGAYDQLRLSTLGRENSIACGTSLISNKQLESLHGIHYRLGLDADDSGIAGMQSAIGRLRLIGSVSVIDWKTAGCKDPGELASHKQLQHILSCMKSEL